MHTDTTRVSFHTSVAGLCVYSYLALAVFPSKASLYRPFFIPPALFPLAGFPFDSCPRFLLGNVCIVYMGGSIVFSFALLYFVEYFLGHRDVTGRARIPTQVRSWCSRYRIREQSCETNTGDSYESMTGMQYPP
jgi:hypothetical protein